MHINAHTCASDLRSYRKGWVFLPKVQAGGCTCVASLSSTNAIWYRHTNSTVRRRKKKRDTAECTHVARGVRFTRHMHQPRARRGARPTLAVNFSKTFKRRCVSLAEGQHGTWKRRKKTESFLTGELQGYKKLEHGIYSRNFSFHNKTLWIPFQRIPHRAHFCVQNLAALPKSRSLSS